MKEQRFFRCKICGNLVGVIDDSGMPMVCCGENMEELVANKVDAATEKHIPEVKIEGCLLHAKVGSIPHPMTEEHHIEFIYLQTKNGGQIKRLQVGKDAVATFAITEDSPCTVFEYCNLHGLWKLELPCKKQEEGGDPEAEMVCSAEFSDGCQ